MIKRSNDPESADADRPLSEAEEQLLQKFDDNDKEIDSMLEGIIDQVDRIKLHAQGISTQINKQDKLLHKLQTRVDNSWGRLERKNNDLQNVLEKYRKSDRLCCDFIMVLIIISVGGIAISILKGKGYL